MLQQAIAATRRNNGALFYIPANFAGAWTDSVGADPVNEFGDVIGFMTDRSYGSGGLGPELVSNGYFSSNLAGWTTQSPATATLVSGAMRVSRNNGSFVNQPATPINVVAGRAYMISMSVAAAPIGGGVARLSMFGANRLTDYTPTGVITATAVGNYVGVFYATVTETANLICGIATVIAGQVDIDNISVKEIFGAVATQSTTANKPTIQKPASNNVIRFDASNDSLFVNLASGGSPFVRSYTRNGTVSGATSATASGFVLGQPTVAGRDVCAIVCAPSPITGTDLAAIERFAVSIGATL